MSVVYNGYQRCLAKAVDRTRDLLRNSGEVQDSEKMHAVKSVLYAAIERAGMESERLITAQELLRELLALVAMRADPIAEERREAMRIIEKLSAHHAPAHYSIKDDLGSREEEVHEIRAL